MPILFVIGLLIIIGGLTLFVSWFGYFWELLKALLPLVIVTLGGVLTYFGWEERKDRKGAVLDFSSPAEASRYQAEALAYQEKLSGLQDSQDADDPAGLKDSPAEEQNPPPAKESPNDEKKDETAA
ncbi:MAG: hypothetical protein LBP22_10350 [Deltaproteobacteria bacterium]|jgi:hypothetical protein|nr:hypothetical protein [Deltaproteobacteria bacterium]